jgi:flagellar biosynthesis anti-sigma factor FlgM
LRITEQQVRYAVESRKAQATDTPAIYERECQSSSEADLIRQVREEVLAMPEVREEMVARLKEAIDKGEYQVSGEDIVDAMIRRELADGIR